MGVDPGSNLLGFSFLRISDTEDQPYLLRMGVLDMRAQEDHLGKLQQIYEELSALVKLYEPTEAAIEAPFYGKDAQAMLKLGRAQGVAMVAMSIHGIKVTEYSPKSIKQAVTGKGTAAKEQLAQMLPHLVKGDFEYKFLDASDAVGVAYCHYINSQTPFSKTALKSKTAKAPRSKAAKGNPWAQFLQDNPDRL